MSYANSTIVAGPREFLSYDDIFIEVAITYDPDEDMNKTRIRRFEEGVDGRKYIRLGDLSLYEMDEIGEIYFDLLQSLELA